MFAGDMRVSKMRSEDRKCTKNKAYFVCRQKRNY